MRTLLCCVLAVVLSGCIPIGIQASTRAIRADAERDPAQTAAAYY